METSFDVREGAKLVARIYVDGAGFVDEKWEAHHGSVCYFLYRMCAGDCVQVVELSNAAAAALYDLMNQEHGQISP